MQKFAFILLFFIGTAFYSVCQPFIVYDTIPIRHGTSKFRLYKNVNKWFEEERGTKLIAKNRKELMFKGKGYFLYTNYVNIPDIFLSPHAAEKTKGSIIFSIDISIQDSIIVTKFSNFIHEPNFSEYGTMSFGKLMDYENVPPGTCMEVEEWCNAVWADMKSWATYETRTRANRLIPAVLIRKNTYKIKEEDAPVAPKTKPYDPEEYLKLDNYLLEDKEGKYADYNKDEEEIAAEAAAAKAALEEKENKKKKKEESEGEELDEYEDLDTETEEVEAVTPAIEPEQKEEKEVSEYDEEEEKPVKNKKSKKQKNKYEDEYDDYYDEE